MEEFKRRTARLRRAFAELATSRITPPSPRGCVTESLNDDDQIVARLLAQQEAQKMEMKEQFELKLAAMEAERDGLQRSLTSKELQAHEQTKRLGQMSADFAKASSRVQDLEMQLASLRDQLERQQEAQDRVDEVFRDVQERFEACHQRQALAQEKGEELESTLKRLSAANTALSREVESVREVHRQETQRAETLRRDQERLELALCQAESTVKQQEDALQQSHLATQVAQQQALQMQEVGERAMVAHGGCQRALDTALHYCTHQAVIIQHLRNDLLHQKKLVCSLKETQISLPRLTSVASTSTADLPGNFESNEGLRSGMEDIRQRQRLELAESRGELITLQQRFTQLEEEFLAIKSKELQLHQRAISAEAERALSDLRSMALEQMTSALSQKADVLKDAWKRSISALSDVGIELERERNERDQLEMEVQDLRHKLEALEQADLRPEPNNVPDLFPTVPQRSVFSPRKNLPPKPRPTSLLQPEPMPQSRDFRQSLLGPASAISSDAAVMSTAVPLRLGGQINTAEPLPGQGKRAKKTSNVASSSCSSAAMFACNRCGLAIADRQVTCADCRSSFHSHCFFGQQDSERSVCQSCATENPLWASRDAAPKKRRLLRVGSPSCVRDNLL